MNQRFSLDVNSFQKLLAAAWVVQSQRDAGIVPKQPEELARAQEVASALRRALAMRTTEPAKPPVAAPASQICIAVPAVTRKSPRTVPVYAQARSAGSLALVDEIEGITKAEATPSPALAVVEKPEVEKAPEIEKVEVEKVEVEKSALPLPEQGTAVQVKKNQKAQAPAKAVKVARAPRERKQGRLFLRPAWERVSGVRIRVRVHSIRMPRIAWRPGTGHLYAGSLVVLLIAGNFLFSLLARSQQEARGTMQATNSPPVVWHEQVAGNEVRTAAPKVDPPSDPPPVLESSHRQITDDAVSSAVEDLSRYEIKELQRRAQYGDYHAALTLGMAYEVGRPVKQNCTEAARWITVAAAAGSAAAQYNLALRYRDGDGTAVNLEESQKWLRKAASRGYEKAQAALEVVASTNAVSAGGQD